MTKGSLTLRVTLEFICSRCLRVDGCQQRQGYNLLDIEDASPGRWIGDVGCGDFLLQCLE